MNRISVVLSIGVFLVCGNKLLASSKIDKIYNWSKAALIAGNSLDAVSSYGKYESNILLKDTTGKFNSKGIAIKAGVVAGILFTETYLCKREEKAKKPLMFLNFGIGAVTTGVAIRNWKQ